MRSAFAGAGEVFCAALVGCGDDDDAEKHVGEDVRCAAGAPNDGGAGAPSVEGADCELYLGGLHGQAEVDMKARVWTHHNSKRNWTAPPSDLDLQPDCAHLGHAHP